MDVQEPAALETLKRGTLKNNKTNTRSLKTRTQTIFKKLQLFKLSN